MMGSSTMGSGGMMGGSMMGGSMMGGSMMGSGGMTGGGMMGGAMTDSQANGRHSSDGGVQPPGKDCPMMVHEAPSDSAKPATSAAP